ncbi:hydrolase [Motilimonas pumila]|nr:hydrolase [Motilimonas pumila]
MSHEFIAPSWCRHHHLQTLLPTLLNPKLTAPTVEQRLITPDDDFLDLTWSSQPTTNEKRTIIVIFHGLEGSAHSPYAVSLLNEAHRQGKLAVLMHFRGCSGEPNRQPRSYHSGEMGDPLFVLAWLQQAFPLTQAVCIGYSLGGNMLLNLLAEHAPTYVKAAVSVSAPLKLALCADRLNQGFSKIYQRHLITRMKGNLKNKMQQVDFGSKVSWELDKLNDFRSFDDRVTAPLHGFSGANDYYRQCSAFDKLKQIQTPSLIIHAADDPFMTPAVIPSQQQVSSSIELQISATGGHVGFVMGKPARPEYWLPRAILQWLQPWFSSAK